MSNPKKPAIPSVRAKSVAVNRVTTLTQPGPVPAPAAIIGTANKGPAFIPFDIANTGDLEKVYGTTAESVKNSRFGLLAAERYFENNGSSVVYLRTLGAGDCKSRTESGGNEGRVSGAGFVVGSEITNTGTNLVGPNPYAGSGGQPGRTFFLAALMSESNGSSFLSDSGIQTGPSSVPVLRGILFSPSGVNISLNSAAVTNNDPTSVSYGENGAVAGTGATATLLVTDAGGILDGETFVLVNSAGVSTTYRFNAAVAHGSQPGGTAGGIIQLGFSGAGGGASGKVNIAAAIVASITATTDADFTAVSDGTDTVTVTQSTVGAAGDRNSTDGVTDLTVGNFSGGDDGVPANGGSGIGTVYGLNKAISVFALVLNGHTSGGKYPNVITASFEELDTDYAVFDSQIGSDDAAVNPATGKSVYFPNVFNRDPTKIQEAGHYLHTYYDIPQKFAIVTGTGVIAHSQSGKSEPIALILTSSCGRNTGSITNITDNTVGVPNFENFQDRFSAPFSPFVTSQKFFGKRFDLFRFHCFSDGADSRFLKFLVSNIRPGQLEAEGTFIFNVDVFNSKNVSFNQVPLHSFENCSLDPSSPNFIARIVGDRHPFYDFDTDVSARKTVIEGSNVLTQQLVRVEASRDVLDGKVPPNAVPCGFRGIHHLVTSGSNASNPAATKGSSTFNGLADLVDDDGTELILRNADGSTVTFVTRAAFDKSSQNGGYGTPITLGTGDITSNQTATEALWNAFSYAIELETSLGQPGLKMSLLPTDWPVGGLTEITLTHNSLGTSGNTLITIPANITANGTTGAGSTNFSGGLSLPTSILTGSFGPVSSLKVPGNAGKFPGNNVLRSVTQPAIAMRERLSIGLPGTDDMIITSDGISWGIRYEKRYDPSLGSIATVKPENTTQNLLQFYPGFHTAIQNPSAGDNHGTQNVGGCVLDADVFNRNFFTLERIAIITGSDHDANRSDLLPDPREWAAAKYIRSENLPTSLIKSIPSIDNSGEKTSDKVRFVEPERDCADQDSRPYLKFTVPMMGGFDGLNIFDQESKNMTDVSVYRERYDTGIVGKNASSTAAYRKAIEIMAEKSETDMSVFTVPGIRHKSVTDLAIQTAEDNFGCMFIADVELYVSGNYVTGTLNDNETLDFGTTITSFRNRVSENSFAAAYINDVIIDFDVEDVEIINAGVLLPPKKVPATVAALGVIARTDDLLGIHASPMGFVRGKVIGSKDIEIEFENSEIAALIKNNINPILDVISPPDAPDGMTIVSQATMTTSDSAFDRIGNRRLLIFIRRGVRNIARQILFEPKDQSLVLSFKKDVGSFLTNLQTNKIISDFDIVMTQNITRSPTSNNLQANMDKFKPFGNILNRTNNELESKTIRGSIIIGLTESSEKIQIDIDESSE
jgi:hypothetical protein